MRKFTTEYFILRANEIHRNNYEIIGYLIQTLLNIDPTNIIAEDKKYVKEYFSI